MTIPLPRRLPSVGDTYSKGDIEILITNTSCPCCVGVVTTVGGTSAALQLTRRKFDAEIERLTWGTPR